MNMQISIIIPVYNAAEFLSEAVMSALAQPETAEVLLIEDGSEDNSLEVCNELEKGYKKVRLFTHKNNENLGAGESRNVGIRNAQYDYIAFLDADDYYLENRFLHASKILNENQDIDGVYEAIETRFESEEVESLWRAKHNGTLTTLTKQIKPGELLEYLIFGSEGYFSGIGLTVRKRIFEKCGMFEPLLQISQDTHMWYKMAVVGKLVGGSLDKPVSVRRVHSGNRITAVSEDDMFNIRTVIWTSLDVWIHSIDIKLKYKVVIKFQKFYNESLKRLEPEKRKAKKLNLIKSLILFSLRSPFYGLIMSWRYFVFYLLK